MMHIRTNRLSSGLLLILLCGALALAQNATGSIRGTVMDEQRAVVANVTVTVTNRATGSARSITTNNEGVYTVENLLPGDYEVKTEAQGFTTQIQNTVVQIGRTTTSDFLLQVGSARETVTVSTEAAILNTTDNQIGGVITRERVENLPLNGRSFLSLALLEPAVQVTYNANSGPGNVNNYFQVSIAGAPQSMTLISIDGARANDRITGGTSQNFSPETVQEFQISTFQFDLSSGTTSAGAINIVSRTGGNSFHGSGFFFFRDHNISAYPAFKRPCDPSSFNPGCNNPALRPSLEDPFFVRRQGGFTASGPFKRDRLFWFGNFERTNQVGARPIAFSNAVAAQFNHIGKQPFKGHLLNTRFDYKLSDKHSAFLRYSHDDNKNVSGTGMESTWFSSGNFAWQALAGVTSVLRPTLVNDFRASYSYFGNGLNPPTPEECGDPRFCFGLGGPQINFGGFFTIGNNAQLTQNRLLRTIQLTENVNWIKGTHRVRFGGNWERHDGRGSWNRVFQGVFSTFSPTQLQTQAPALFAALPESLKNPVGIPSFADLLKLPVSGTLSVGIGDPGQPPAFRGKEAQRNDAFRLYLQDAWQIRPGFTFNYGLAWSFEDNIVSHDLDRPEYLKPFIPELRATPQDWNNFDPAIGFAWSLGKQNKTVIRAGAGLHHTSTNTIFQRLTERSLIGPAGNGLVIVNAAVEPNPFFNPQNPTAQPATLNFSTPTTFSAQNMLDILPGLKTTLQSRLPGGTDLAVRGIDIIKSTSGIDLLFNSDFVTPYTLHINAGVQREIARNLAVTVDFAMRRGVKFGAFEGYQIDLNRFNRFSGYTLGSTGTASPVRSPVLPVCTSAQRANPAFRSCAAGAVTVAWPGLTSRYMAMLVKVDKRFSSGFQFTGSYALSRYYLWNGNQDYNNINGSYGLSGQPKHRFTFSGIWELPTYKGDQRILRGLLNGWQVSMISEVRSAGPESVSIGTFDLEGDGTFTFRLPGTTNNQFGRGFSVSDIRRLVDQYNATFPAPASTALRDIPAGPRRDAIGTAFPVIILPDNFSNGDSFISQDIRVARTVKLHEKVRLVLIAESFNFFNIANLTGYSGTLNALSRPATTGGTPTLPSGGLTFGQPSDRVSPVFGTGGPRSFQFAARISW
jgi:hypothetical protein